MKEIFYFSKSAGTYAFIRWNYKFEQIKALGDFFILFCIKNDCLCLTICRQNDRSFGFT